MGRLIKRLSARQVANAKPKKGYDRWDYPDGGNLYLQASHGKPDEDGHVEVRRSWVFKYQLNGERHELGLGSVNTFSLAEARERAKELRQQLALGTDPLAAKKEAKRELLARQAERAKVVTFRQCAEMYLDVHADRWKNAKHRAQWGSTLRTYAYPLIGDLAVADVDESHLVKILQPLWKRIPETASRLRARIENVLGYATASRFRSGDNPARWRGHLKTLLGGAQKDVEHHAALPFIEAPSFMAELRKRNSTSARALQFLILTATRTGEVVGARWNEIDLKEKTWTIPAERMKTGVEHRVPLSNAAIEILSELPHRGHVFAGTNGHGLSNMAMLELLRGMRPGLTVHGFRSSFADWAADRTNSPKHVRDKALAHKVSDKVEAAYRRTDLFEKRRRLMQQWAEFLAKPPIEETTANVTPTRARV
jgi:integrase